MDGRALTDEDVQAVAAAVVALLPARPPVLELLKTAQVAAMIDVGEEWVREHAAELGAIRVGDGPKGELRFERERVLAALERRRLETAPKRKPQRPGPRQQPRSEVKLFEPSQWAA